MWKAETLLCWAAPLSISVKASMRRKKLALDAVTFYFKIFKLKLQTPNMLMRITVVSIQVIWESPDCLERWSFAFRGAGLIPMVIKKQNKMKIPRQGRKLDMHREKSNFVAKNKGFLFVANHRWRGKMNELTHACCQKQTEVVMLICQKGNIQYRMV